MYRNCSRSSIITFFYSFFSSFVYICCFAAVFWFFAFFFVAAVLISLRSLLSGFSLFSRPPAFFYTCLRFLNYYYTLHGFAAKCCHCGKAVWMVSVSTAAEASRKEDAEKNISTWIWIKCGVCLNVCLCAKIRREIISQNIRKFHKWKRKNRQTNLIFSSSSLYFSIVSRTFTQTHHLRDVFVVVPNVCIYEKKVKQTNQTK